MPVVETSPAASTPPTGSHDTTSSSARSIEVADDDSAVHTYQSLNRQVSDTSSTGVSDGISVVQGSLSVITWGQFLGAVANLCSATLGAGILALPFAMYQSGLLCGFLLLLSSGWATAASINLIVQACDYYGLATYESVVEKALGSRWRQIVEISILIFCGGTAVAYCIAVGDIMERVEDVGRNSHKRIAMSLVWLVAMLPLSCLRRMQSLQCASSVGILSIGTLLVAATVHLFIPTEDLYDSKVLEMQDVRSFLWPRHGGMSVLLACPIFFFAYSCQVNVAQIYDELRMGQAVGTDSLDSRHTAPCVRSMGWVAWLAIGLCTLLYGSISVVTLMDFGGHLQPNILSCYHLHGKESVLLHFAFLAMAIAVIMAFPLNIFPARLSIIQMWDAATSKGSLDPMLLCVDVEEARQPLISKNGANSTYRSSDQNETTMDRGFDDDPLRQPPESTKPLIPQPSNGADPAVATQNVDDEEEFDARQHRLVTLLVAASALGLALVVPNISVVFGLLGGTTSSLLGFVVPGMLGLTMDGSNKLSAWVLVVAGSFIGVVTTGVTLYSTVHGVL